MTTGNQYAITSESNRLSKGNRFKWKTLILNGTLTHNHVRILRLVQFRQLATTVMTTTTGKQHLIPIRKLQQLKIRLDRFEEMRGRGTELASMTRQTT